jgi:hypothetical protein
LTVSAWVRKRQSYALKLYANWMQIGSHRSARRSYPTYHTLSDEFADAARGPHGFVGHLGDANWLDGAFNAGDLLMLAVLRRLNGSGIRRLYTLSSN